MEPTPATLVVNWGDRLKGLNSPDFRELFPAQEAALSAYTSAGITKPNVAIELPTGAGKSLIALLILEYWMSLGKRTAVLCGTKNLARQFKAEADALGVQAVLFEGAKNTWKATDKFRYSRGQAIAVLNYWGYINQSPGLDPADILVLDDAHLAENAAHGLFSLEIGRGKHLALYTAVVGAIATQFPHYTAAADYHQDNHTPFSPIELINFTDWIEFLPRLEAIMAGSSDCQVGGSLFFEWNRIKRSLKSALCLISGRNVSIRPGCYPLENEAHIQKPAQRIFLSATIGTADDLARRVGISGIESLSIDSKYKQAVPGKRLLIFPESEGREDEMEALALDAALRIKRSVWLCASAAEVEIWSDRLSQELAKRNITDQPLFIAEGQAEEIDQFVDAKLGHLFTASRYDGMDFEGDTCRLVVMPSLPQACGPYERFISENLSDASFMYSRVLQRMTQALGRATRNDHDWAVYIFLQNSLTHYLTSGESFQQLPSNVQEEIGFGVDISSRPIDEISKIFSSFMRGKLAEIQFPQKELKFPATKGPEKSRVADDEVAYWHRVFALHSFDQAARSAESAAKALAEDGQPGYALFWRYLKAQAAYLRYDTDNDPSGLSNAQSELAKILDEPRQSAWFSRLNRLRQGLNLEMAPDDQHEQEQDVIVASWNQLLGGELRNPSIHNGWFENLRAGLLMPDHKHFCHAVRRLFNLLGWDAEIKDKLEGETDVVATISLEGSRHLLIIEGKPEMDAEKAWPLRYISQALGQLERYTNDASYKKYNKAVLLVGSSEEIGDSAILPAKSVTFVKPSSLIAISDRAIAAFQRYSSIRYKKGFLPKRSECAEALRMTPIALGLMHATALKGSVLADEDVFAYTDRDKIDNK